MVIPIQSKESLEVFTREKLEWHYQSDNVFGQGMADLFTLYQGKFFQFIREENERKLFEEDIIQSMQSQIFKGYAIGREIYTDEDTVIPDNFLRQTDKLLKEMVPLMIISQTDHLRENFRTQRTQNMISKMIVRYENILPICNSFEMSATMFGAWYAFLDLKKDRELITLNLGSQELHSMLHHPGDIWFIDPEKYAACIVINEESETWLIKPWSSYYPKLDTIGEIVIQYVSKEKRQLMNSHLPFYRDNELPVRDEIYVSLILEAQIPDYETEIMGQVIIDRIKTKTKLTNEQIFFSLKTN